MIAHLSPDHKHNTRLQTQNNLIVWKCNMFKLKVLTTN